MCAVDIVSLVSKLALILSLWATLILIVNAHSSFSGYYVYTGSLLVWLYFTLLDLYFSSCTLDFGFTQLKYSLIYSKASLLCGLIFTISIFPGVYREECR